MKKNSGIITNEITNVTFNENPAFQPTCAGNACGSLTYRYSSGNYFKNNSGQNVDVNIKNWVASEVIHLSPGEEQKSFIDAFENPYLANFV